MIKQILANVSITEDEVNALPTLWREVYTAKKQLRRITELEENQQLKEEIKEKVDQGEALDEAEVEFVEEQNHHVSKIESAEVEVEAIDILTDIVNGDYTLEDVHSVREGVEAAADKDPVENSPLQLLDNIVEGLKVQVHEVLQTKEPGSFFGSSTGETINEMSSEQIADVINNAATAIDLAQGSQLEQNEAKEAWTSLIKALAMSEAEMKIKKAQEINQKRTEENENLAEAAAVAGVVSSPATEADRALAFDITEVNYDISFLPSNDPSVYKPLEIISYIGLTENVG